MKRTEITIPTHENIAVSCCDVVCTVDKHYCHFGGTTCPILHPKYGRRFLQKQFFCLHDASIRKTLSLTHTHSPQPKISHENIKISFLRDSSRRRYVKIYHHTNKETSLRFTVQITRKCTFTVFIRHENQHRTQSARARAHTHTHRVH